MNFNFSSLFSIVYHALGGVTVAVALAISSLFGYTAPEIVVVDTPPTTIPLPLPTATSSLPVASTSVASPAAPVPVIKKVIPLPAATTTSVIPAAPVYILPNPANHPVAVATSTPPSTELPPPTVAIGTTTLAVGSVPLLSGGTAHPGQSVAISYLQITNVGTAGAELTGFWVKQDGSASTTSIIGLSTIDDRGGSQGLAGGTEGSVLFQNGLAFAPTSAYFVPGQMRLFTIKAILTHNTAPYVGGQLMLDVSSVQTTALVQGQFPIVGTTWTIAGL